MPELSIDSEVKFEIVDPARVERAVAVGVTMLYRDAYVGRFVQAAPNTEIFASQQHAIAEKLVADPLNPAHVEETLEALRDPHYTWALATRRELGYVSVLGLALSYPIEVKGEPSEIFLADLHVHPHVQRQGLAAGLARLSLAVTALNPLFKSTDEQTTVRLNVARQQPANPDEHPAAWYRRLGFRKTGPGERLTFGSQSYGMERMKASYAEVDAALFTATQKNNGKR